MNVPTRQNSLANFFPSLGLIVCSLVIECHLVRIWACSKIRTLLDVPESVRTVGYPSRFLASNHSDPPPHAAHLNEKSCRTAIRPRHDPPWITRLIEPKLNALALLELGRNYNSHSPAVQTHSFNHSDSTKIDNAISSTHAQLPHLSAYPIEWLMGLSSPNHEDMRRQPHPNSPIIFLLLTSMSIADLHVVSLTLCEELNMGHGVIHECFPNATRNLTSVVY